MRLAGAVALITGGSSGIGAATARALAQAGACPLVAGRNLPRLRELSMDSTGVTDSGAQTLKSMAGLKSLNLYHTLVTEKGWQEIKSALPSCEIVFDRDSALPSRRSK